MARNRCSTPFYVTVSLARFAVNSSGHVLRHFECAHASANKTELFSFLRDIVAIESFDGNEGAVIQRIRQEMEKVGFDRIEIDPMGNLLGYLGHGRHLIAMDAHIDTVR